MVEEKRFLMLQPVSRDELHKIANIFSTFEDGYAHCRKDPVREQLPLLSQEALEFLNFCYYFLSKNRIWKGIDPDHYVAVMCGKNSKSNTGDLVKLLRHYGNRRPQPDTESILIKFLQGCSKTLKHFFVELLARNENYLKLFNIIEVRELLALHPVDPDALYAGMIMLRNEEDKPLQYPVIACSLPSATLMPAILSKSKGTLRIKIHSKGKKETVYIPAFWLDFYNIQDASVLLYGMLDIEDKAFYPLDLFESPREYRKYLKDPNKDLKGRQERLDKFQDRNFLVFIKRTERFQVYSNSQVPDTVGKAMLSGEPVLHLCDFRHTHHNMLPERQEGVIGDLWKVGEVTLGFQIWKNSYATNCVFDFTGRNNGLLYNPLITRGKKVIYYQFEVGGLKAAAVSLIDWEKYPYSKRTSVFADGNIGYIDRCPFCVRDEFKATQFGVCSECLRAFRHKLAVHGANSWFPVSPVIQRRRLEFGWIPSGAQKVLMSFRGHVLKVNDEGLFMFAPEEGVVKSLEIINKNRKVKYADTEAMTAEEAKAWYSRFYKRKGQNDLPRD